MSLRLPQGVLNSPQAFVCLPCRLRKNASQSIYLSSRYLHTEATQAGPKSAEAPLITPKTNNVNTSSESAQNAVKASPQAKNLHDVLQQQFAERRRQSNKKLGLPQRTQLVTAEPKSGTKVKATTSPKQGKIAKVGRRARSTKSKPGKRRLPSSTDASSDLAIPVERESRNAKSETLVHQQPTEVGKPDQLSTGPFVKLQKDVQRLKKALATDDKAKRTSKIRLAELQSPKSENKSLPRRVISKTDISTQPVRKIASDKAEDPPRDLPVGMRSLKNALVRTVSSIQRVKKAPEVPSKLSSRREEKTSEICIQRPLTLPRGIGARDAALIEVVNAESLKISAVEIEQPPVPHLSYGLERVLFNPGVYHLQDPRSRVYNFDPYLERIMPVNEFDFSALKAYVTSSSDATLKQIAQRNGKRYIGSSSSMTSVLAHFHFLLSQWREIGTSMLSNKFPKTASKSFTIIQKAPTAVFLRWRDGTYAIDADKQFANANILMMLGKSMEKLLTLKKDDFERYRKSNESIVPPEERNSPESYHYSTMGDFLMRSQLDAHDARLPGTGMFDLKTRAVVSVRMDSQEVEKGMGYEIKDRLGEWESYEREYYDMMRSAMLKYSLQVRMGRMDGIFVAYHNTQRIFGFQYISLAEMDAALHGQWDTALGDQQFKISLDLLNKVLNRATKKYPEQSLRIHFETREAQTPFMYIFAEPVTEDQIRDIQSENDAEIAEYERRVMGIQQDIGAATQHDEDGRWADMQADVEEEMDKDEVSLSSQDDQSVASEEAKQDNPEVKDSKAVDKGPLWKSARSEGSQDEPIVAVANEDDVEGEHENEDQDVSEREEADSMEEEQGSREDPEEFLEDGVGADEEASELTAASKIFLDEDDMALGEELPTGSAKENTLGGHDSNTEVEYPSGADDAETEGERVSDTEDTFSISEQSPEDDSSDLGEQSAAVTNKESIMATNVPSEKSAAAAAADISHSQEVLAMTLTIRNKVNDRYIVRPENLSSRDTWIVEHAIAEVGDKSKAWKLYQASQARRAKALERDDDDDENKTVDWFIRNLRQMSDKGQRWRQEQDKLDRSRPKFILGRSSANGEILDTGNPDTES